LGAGEKKEEEEDHRRGFYEEERVFVLTLADKLRMLFNHDFPSVSHLRTRGVWCAGELLEYGGDFNKYITTKRLQKQEGVIFRHLLRLILIIKEFAQICPAETTEELWQADLFDIADQLTASCRVVDQSSTDKVLEETPQKTS